MAQQVVQALARARRARQPRGNEAIPAAGVGRDRSGDVVCRARRRHGAAGITWAGWKGDYRAFDKKLETFKAVGFQIVSFVPNYAYVGLDKIDLAAGPDATELGAAVEAALRAGFTVVLKPHLDPPAFQPGSTVQVG